jgi:flagellar hook-basal body complex protein FliE
MAIDALATSLPLVKPSGPGAVTPAAGETAGATFGESLHNLLSSVDGSTGAANSAVSDMLTGTGDVHQAMIALQRAEMTLELTIQIRNKLVQAYQDVMRMPV